MEFMLLGQDLSAERAFEVGMVNKVVPLGSQLEAALEYARILERSAPLVVSTIKQLLLRQCREVLPRLRLSRVMRCSRSVIARTGPKEERRLARKGHLTSLVGNPCELL